ncbi:GNAT family N-acetyltransferase [Actinomadura geliboluensis]|uniref:GNAT family N-acetyltransferase n=1 Tax=Actinomadura geliboluensis TaxID=882440 RepID=UPI00371996E2
MDVAIRRLGPADWRTWRDLRLAALRDAPSAFSSSLERELGYDEQRWRAGMAPERGVKVAARLGGADVGIAGGYVTRPGQAGQPGEAELFGMWVAPAARGTGVADGLVDAVVSWAEQHGLRLQLWVVTGNIAARRLYGRHGFELTGTTEPHANDPRLCEHQMVHALGRPAVPGVGPG